MGYTKEAVYNSHYSNNVNITGLKRFIRLKRWTGINNIKRIISENKFLTILIISITSFIAIDIILVNAFMNLLITL